MSRILNQIFTCKHTDNKCKLIIKVIRLIIKVITLIVLTISNKLTSAINLLSARPGCPGISSKVSLLLHWQGTVLVACVSVFLSASLYVSKRGTY